MAHAAVALYIAVELGGLWIAILALLLYLRRRAPELLYFSIFFGSSMVMLIAEILLAYWLANDLMPADWMLLTRRLIYNGVRNLFGRATENGDLTRPPKALSERDREIAGVVRHTLLAGEAVTCPLVLLELWNGARGEVERAQISRLSDDLPSLEVDNSVWTLSWEIAQASRSRGITIPPTDLLVIAVAEHHGAELVHCDSHFELYLNSGR